MWRKVCCGAGAEHPRSVLGRSVPVDQHSLVSLGPRRPHVLLRVTRRACPCPTSSSVCHDPLVRPRRLGDPGPFRCSRGGGAAHRGALQFLRVPLEAITGRILPEAGARDPCQQTGSTRQIEPASTRGAPAPTPWSPRQRGDCVCAGLLTADCRGQAERVLVEGQQSLLGFGGRRS